MSRAAITRDSTPHLARPLRAAWAWPVVFAAALVLYVATLAPGVLWQDNGLAQVRVLRRDIFGSLGLALSHPLYYVLAIAFQALPFAESAYKTNLVSAVFGAVAVANLFVLVRRASGSGMAALIAATSLAVAHTFWQHAVMAEVYALTAALLTTELLCIERFLRTGRAGWFVLLFAVNGLSISNHMVASLSTAVYGVWAVVELVRGRVRWRTAAVAAVAWLLGASLYGGLIVTRLAAGDGFSATIRSALFGIQYEDQVLNVSLSPRAFAKSVMYLALDFPTPAVLLLVPALAGLRRGGWRSAWGMVAALAAVHLAWAMRYNVVDQYTMFVPSIVLVAALIGCGAARFLAARTTHEDAGAAGGGPAGRTRSRRWRGVLWIAAALPAAVYAPLPAIARALNVGSLDAPARAAPMRDAYTYFLWPWKGGYDGPARFAAACAARVPDGGAIIADSTTVRPIHYWQLTRDWHKTVKVYPPLVRPNDGTGVPRPDLLAGALDAGRVYVVRPIEGWCPRWLLVGYTLERDGPLYRVTGPKPSAPATARAPS